MEESEASLHDDLKGEKPYIHHLKVVDPGSKTVEVLAYAKWEVYKHGRPDLERLRQPPTDEEPAKVDEFGELRAVARRYFSSRNGEMGKSPHIREVP